MPDQLGETHTYASDYYKYNVVKDLVYVFVQECKKCCYINTWVGDNFQIFFAIGFHFFPLLYIACRGFTNQIF